MNQSEENAGCRRTPLCQAECPAIDESSIVSATSQCVLDRQALAVVWFDSRFHNRSHGGRFVKSAFGLIHLNRVNNLRYLHL